MLTQLNPPLPLETVKGSGWAHFVIDYGPEAALLWVVFMDADGACWTVPNPEVRMSANWTMGRRPDKKASPFADEGQRERSVQRLRPTLAVAPDTWRRGDESHAAINVEGARPELHPEEQRG